MKKTLIFTCTFLFSLFSFSQNNFYYYKSKKTPLILDKSSLNIVIENNFQKEDIINLGFKDFIVQNLSTNSNNNNLRNIKIEFITNPSDFEYLQKINSIKNISTINFVQPSFIINDSKISLSNFINVKLKKSSDINKLRELALSKNVIIIGQNEFMPLWYSLKCNKNSDGNTLEIANLIFETGLFEASEPDFVIENPFGEDISITTSTNPDSNSTPPANCVNDINFNQQWSLANTGQWDGQQYGIAGVDIKACDAWTISKGTNIKVAVFDTGVDATLNDLSNNVLPLSYNVFTQGLSNNNDFHGTNVAYLIAGMQNNNLYGSGVAPESKIIDISSSNYLSATSSSTAFEISQTESRFANGINWAWENGADVLNCSLVTFIQTSIMDDALINALTLGRNGLGTIIIGASGNYPFNGNSLNVMYPANFSDVISVGAINSKGIRPSFSKYGIDLDVVAPSNNVPALSQYSGQYSFTPLGGTSAACPHVSGVAALVLSVNPCLTSAQVRTIIETTCQKVGNYNYVNTPNRPNGTWNEEMGYGLVNAYAAVLMAQQMITGNQSADLYIKDNLNDNGTEPNTELVAWNSPDIWVRNQQDNIQIHQAPLYNPTNPNYVYVKVRNKGCTVSGGNEIVKLYANLPNGNTNNTYESKVLSSSFIANNNNSYSLQEIGSINLPIINSGQSVIVEFPWLVPNGFGWIDCTTLNINTLLYAKIIANTEPLFLPETASNYQNVLNNNNIASKSVLVTGVQNLVSQNENNTYESIISIENPFDDTRNFKIELVEENNEIENSIYEESEVRIKMDDILYNAWQRGGKLAENIDDTLNDKMKIVNGNNVLINNLNLNGLEHGKLTLNFNFLIDKFSKKTRYNYNLILHDISTNEIVGGTTIQINKNIRQLFNADAGEDLLVDKNEQVTISAQQINEAVVYNWYDSDGLLIFQGKDLSISAQVSKKYKLEVIASIDGFKDYSEVDVSIKPSSIKAVSPNPASNLILVDYKLNDASSAYLMILGSYGTTYASNNYILDLNSNQKSIDISNFTNGFYIVALICNGQIVDTKTIMKE